MAKKGSFKKKLELFLIPRIFKLFFVFVGNSCRKKWIGKEVLDQLKAENKNCIYSFWHNNIALASWTFRNQNLLALASASNDGELIARVLESTGNDTIRGSSSKGGFKALLQMIKQIKKGQPGAITPDGPRGPKYVLQSGTISLAQKSKVPLIPVHIEASRQWIFKKSWDQHKLPKPFATILIAVGEPFYVPERLSGEEFLKVKLEFEEVMKKNQEKCTNLIKNIRNKNGI